MWKQNTNGAIYNCVNPVIPGTGGFWLWSLNPPAGPAAPIDPAVLAQQAIQKMGLKAVEIGIVPEPGPDSVGLIGLPTWMWTNPTEQTWGPVSATASAGGVTVTAKATVDRVEWAMGDGITVTCTTPGTPYQDGYGDAFSPDCGHRYTRTSVREPDDAYTVTATSFWLVNWTGGGSSGSIPVDFTSETQIRVGELQALITQ